MDIASEDKVGSIRCFRSREGFFFLNLQSTVSLLKSLAAPITSSAPPLSADARSDSVGVSHRVQELCESRGGRPGLPSLINLRFLWT